MKIKKPSLKGMKNCEYLQHFCQDKYIEQGHNFSGKISLSDYARDNDPMSAVKEKRPPSADYSVKFDEPMSIGVSSEKREKVSSQIRRQLKNMKAIEKIKDAVSDVADRDRRLAPELERRMRMRARMKRERKY